MGKKEKPLLYAALSKIKNTTPLYAALVIGGLVASSGCQQNHPPATPSNPDPSDGSVVSQAAVTLFWCGGDPDPELPYYDVYFGETNPPPLREVNIDEKSYTVNDLKSSTTYYWMIVAQDERGDTSCGPLWSFETQADTYEPNNWFDEAYGPIDLNKSLQSYIRDQHDVDFYYFVPYVNGKATITLEDLPADYDLFLCDGSENLLAYSENPKLEEELIVTSVVAWDIYYVIVRPCESCDPEDPYTLNVGFEESKTDTYEPNNWFDGAYGPLEFGKNYESWIWNWDDGYDFYYFIPDSNARVKISLTSLPGDYDLWLGNQYQEEIDWSSNSGTEDEFIYHYLTGSEIYYAVVVSDNSPDSTDSYILQVSYDTSDSYDSYEPNNSFDEASGPLNEGYAYESWISSNEDVDYYYFTPTSDEWVDIYLYNLPANYDLYLFDEWADIVSYSENSGTYDEWVGSYVTAYQTYYIVIESYGDYDPYDSYFFEFFLYNTVQKEQFRTGGKIRPVID